MEEAMERAKKTDALARQVFKLVRDFLLLKMRFLDMALFHLELGLPVGNRPQTATICITIYNPENLLRWYKGEKNAVARDYMHVLLHCIF